METALTRAILPDFIRNLRPNKALLLLGPRRVGKTILLKQIIAAANKPYLLLNGEDLSSYELLKTRTVANYKNLLGDNKLLIIDEAQKIPDIGTCIKLMVDEIEGLTVILTGSSAFDLYNQVGEPLTGRKLNFNLFPLAQSEYSSIENRSESTSRLEERMIFGNYPELLHYTTREDKIRYLNEVVQSYLLRDILALDNIRNSGKIFDLLKLLAYQIGKEVSLDELGRQLGMSKNTVERYLDLLSKVFIIYKVPAYSRNLRKEIAKSSRWYFTDNGIRNTMISNYQPLTLRNDIGALWENYILSERIKHLNYSHTPCNTYFWRTYDQQEIDWIEERDGKLFAYELKWNNEKSRMPKAFEKAYPDSSFDVITKDNYWDWIMPSVRSLP